MNRVRAPGRAISPREILEQLDLAIVEHMVWLKAWHRRFVCGDPPFVDDLGYDPRDLGTFGSWYVRNQHRGLVNQPAIRTLANLHKDIHEQARSLAAYADEGRPPPRADYDAFMDATTAFVAQARRLERAFAQASSDLDPLTGLHNRQAMTRELERERERAIRSRRSCCFALADLDRFKNVNDTHGHTVGDQVLRASADCFLGGLRPYDSVYRYGGEEFLFCLPDTPLDDARRVLERLREDLRDTPIVLVGGQVLNVTASFGLAQVDQEVSVEDVIARADAALYQAKADGRDRVNVWSADAAP